jgi:hypothetical protein
MREMSHFYSQERERQWVPAFIYFLPILHLFLQKVGPSTDQFSKAKFVNGQTFSLFCQIWKNLAALVCHHRQIFFSARSTFLPFSLIVMEQPQEDPPLQQANPSSCGQSSGIPNYRNGILINIVKQQLPQGREAWMNVACLYQNASNENELRRGEDICDILVRKLCNNFKKPTGKPDNLTDRIYCCLAIKRRIQHRASAAILGASSGESLNKNDQGSEESDDFSFGGSGVYDDKVAAANSPRNDDAHEPVDADEQQPHHNANEEQLEVANGTFPIIAQFHWRSSHCSDNCSKEGRWIGGTWGWSRRWICQSSARGE